MRVRLTIDRVVLEGVELSAAERSKFLVDLREGLRESVIERLSSDSSVRPAEPRSYREHVNLTQVLEVREAGGGRRLGDAVGAALFPTADTLGGGR
jgi:hypothetical protein